ncbi:adhesion G-protein coupled receptor G4 [Denticeps clupeoides]|uniref:adhesion G-protein coupled receptor G4 n=1 Tax=Denticeps clupeoides TaxID=299321 RepID=UPI0010A51C0B|nr:adhesion G-protein coupled receptor G4-like [Denticeps clupeoides]
MSTLYLLSSGSFNPSLWGKKATLMGGPCYWHLSGQCEVPTLKELSVCLVLQRRLKTFDWTAFEYKLHNEHWVELGLTGSNGRLNVWLFGAMLDVEEDLPLHQWHTICLTWSSSNSRLQVYINGSLHMDEAVNGSLLLGNGTLTLGVSHSLVNGEMVYETGTELMGDITLFRMWSQHMGHKELESHKCVEGDMFTWSERDWIHQGCQLVPDNRLTCDWSRYKIETRISVIQEHSDITENNITKLVKLWLETQFHLNMSVQNIVISPLSLAHSQSNNLGVEDEEKQLLQDVLSQQDMNILNFVMIPQWQNNGCSFQVQAPAGNVTQTMGRIFDCLTKIYLCGSISIQAQRKEINISQIQPGTCPEHDQQTIYGWYFWPETQPQETIIMICEKNSQESATRLCKLDGMTDKAVWDPPDMASCEKIGVDINDLDNITVTGNNSQYVVDIIMTLLTNQTELSQTELNTMLDKLHDVVSISPISTELGEDMVSIVSDMLDTRVDLTALTNRILELTDSIGDKMDFEGEKFNTTVPSLALQIINVNPNQFTGLTFGVSSFFSGQSPEIFVSQLSDVQPIAGNVASISLPLALGSIFPHNSTIRPRVQFHFYGTQSLFKDPGNNMTLNSYIVSASVTNASISDLQQPVIITLHHLIPAKDVSRTPISEKDEQILTIISNLGCGLSSIFLGITLLTYITFEKLRKDYPSKILMNLSFALFGLNMIFLVNSWLASFDNYGLCITVAVVQHFFLLSTFTWMGLEALHMYFALVKVFNIYVHSYILKFCAVGWGLPIVVVCLVLAIDKDVYGNSVQGDSLKVSQDSSVFCWVQNDKAFYATVVSFIALILLFNLIMFGMVLVQIRTMQSNKPARWSNSFTRDLRVVVSLTFLLGLTWLLAFFSWGPVKTPFMYMFAVLNSLQGFFIFIFHCLMNENVKKEWKIHFGLGSNKQSDWSRSMTASAHPQQSTLITSEKTSSIRTVSNSLNSEDSHILTS